jgi:hypothetical protein
MSVLRSLMSNIPTMGDNAMSSYRRSDLTDQPEAALYHRCPGMLEVYLCGTIESNAWA